MIDKHIRVFTLCSGYDSQCLALERLTSKYPSFTYELIGWSDIDKNAIEAHNALFPQWSDLNYGDMTKIDWNTVPDFDLLTFSTPCQDLSAGGKQAGFEKGSGTRSSIMWNVIDAIRTKRPKYLLQENVKALVSCKFIDGFNAFNKEIEKLGYSVFYKVLNSKNFNVPQNRERVIAVSILNYNGIFEYPKEMPLTNTLDKLLEVNVDKKLYYEPYPLNEFLDGKKVDVEHTELKIIGKIFQSLPKELKHGVFIDAYNKQNRAVTSTLLADCAYCFKNNGYVLVNNEDTNHKFRIRRISTNEAFRLMGVSDEDIVKIKKSNLPDKKYYFMAGNSIVVDVLYYVFENMFIKTGNRITALF